MRYISTITLLLYFGWFFGLFRAYFFAIYNTICPLARDYGIIISASTLTIKGGCSVSSNSNAIYCYNNGNVIIDGGLFKGSNAVYAYGGNITINDGTFERTQDGWYTSTVWVTDNSNLTINGGTFNTNSGFNSQRILNARNFSKVSITDGTFNAHYEDTMYDGDIYIGDCQSEDSFVISGGVFNCTISTNYKMKIAGDEFNKQIAISPSFAPTSETNPTLLVTGGTFNVEKAPFANLSKSKILYIVIEGGLFKANSVASNNSKVLLDKISKNCIIYPHGGTYMMNPTETSTNQLGLVWENDTNSITDNYKVVDNNDGTYTVIASINN